MGVPLSILFREKRRIARFSHDSAGTWSYQVDEGEVYRTFSGCLSVAVTVSRLTKPEVIRAQSSQTAKTNRLEDTKLCVVLLDISVRIKQRRS